METSTIRIPRRRVSSSTAIDKTKEKKKKRRRRKGRDGKRSASSTSASGSPDSGGDRGAQKSHSSNCNGQSKNRAESGAKAESYTGVNECLRWPAHSTYIENPVRYPTYFVENFPVSGNTEEEEEERIAIYKLNRRKRYLAAQQALIDKYPNTNIYASSSSASSSGRNTTDGLSMSGSGNTMDNALRNGQELNVTQATDPNVQQSLSRLKPGFLIRANSEGSSLKISSSHIQLTHIPILPSTKSSHHSGMPGVAEQLFANLGSANFGLAVSRSNCSSDLSLNGSRKVISKVQ